MATETNAEPEINPADAIRILKTASCPSLSGKSTLTYNIGCNALSEIQFQVAGNDGGGYFNSDWVAQSSIQAVLDKQPKGIDITSGTFRAIYPSKSTNSPGFLLAVLKDIGLVGTMASNQRCYEMLDPKAFIAEINVLLQSSPEDGAVAMAAGINSGKTLTLKGRPKKA